MQNLILPPNISTANTKAFFSTKEVSGIDPGKLLSDEFGLTAEVYLPIQKHTDKVHILEGDTEPVIADAVITSRKGVLIGVKVADCVPVLLFDKDKLAIGAVHAGWRGTASEILKNSIRTMQDRFSSDPDDIMVAIGPSIKGCSYEVNEEVKDAVMKATGKGDYFKGVYGKYLLDISEANKLQALSMDVPAGNIWVSDECTFYKDEKYHSFRRSGDKAGRQGGFIAMW